MYKWLFYFYLYSFFGWCFESTYVSLKEKRPVNRGFMRGPFLPIYGAGAVMMLVVSRPVQYSILLTYLAGCVGATLLEYIVGTVTEALFRVRYWDYTGKFLNFQGQICLSSTLVWGLFTVLMTRYMQRRLDVVIAVADQALLEEKEELRMKFHILRDRRLQLQSQADFYRRRLLRDNPGMISKRFKGALEDLKEAAKEHYQKRRKSEEEK